MDYFQQHIEQNNEYVQVQTKLSDIYAGIQGQLCSKQSTLMNKLKNNFLSLYSDLSPSHYVIINHVFSLTDFALQNSAVKQSIKMATENGVILLVKQTYLGQKIFINGICDQQLIYESKGVLSTADLHGTSQDYPMAKKIQKTILLANDSMALNKLYGATILLHSTISSSTSYYDQRILLTVFFGIMIANDQLQYLTIEEIYQKLYHSHIFSPQFLSTQFAPFQQGQLLMTQVLQNSGTQNQETITKSFKIPHKQKLLFLNLGINEQQLKNMQKKQGSIYWSIQKTQQRQVIGQIANLSKLKQFAFGINDQLKLGHVSLSEYIQSVNQQIPIKSNIKNICPQIQDQIQQDINQVLSSLGKTQNQYIFSQGHMIFSLKSHEIHQKIRVLRKFINGKLTENPEIIANRFNGAKGVDKIIFSSSPSLAIAVFNPEQQIWFK